MSTKTKKHIVEFVERTSATFIFGFLGVVTAASGDYGLALKAGGIAGGLAVAKFLYKASGTYLGE